MEDSNRNLGSLLRLFKSEYFDSWLAVSYLFKNCKNIGVFSYLCNEFYKFSDEDVEFYLAQLCSIAVVNKESAQPLLGFLLDKSSKSVHFAIKTAWMFSALSEPNNEALNDRCMLLRKDTENASFNQRRSDRHPAASTSGTASTSGEGTALEENEEAMMEIAMAKIERFDYFNQLKEFVQELGHISDRLRFVPIEERKASLRMSLTALNKKLAQTPGLYIPLVSASTNHCSVVNIPPEESVLLNSRERAPYLIIVEVLESNLNTGSEQLVEYIKEYRKGFPDLLNNPSLSTKAPQPKTSSSEPTFVKPSSLFSSGSQPGSQKQNGASSSSSASPTPLTVSTDRALPLVIEEHCKDDENEVVKKDKSNRDGKRSKKNRSSIPDVLSMEDLEGPKISSYDPLCKERAKNDTGVSELKLKNLKLSDGGHRTEKKSPRERNKSRSPREGVERGREEGSARGKSREPEGSESSKASGKTLGPSESTVRGKSREARSKKGGSGVDDWVLLERLADEKQPQTEEEEKQQAAVGDADPQRKHLQSILFLREKWEEKVERIRAKSIFGCLPNWKLQSLIVKFGDDCRQERMALQLISQFHRILSAAKLPLYLRPYNILVLAPDCCLIETVTDAISIHQLKKEHAGISIADYFKQKCEGTDSQVYKIAQANFIESAAAYSLVTYLLQLKDRHNGNILIDNDGHIIHIDFGFMLSNSPGSLNFETSPFKLPQEYIQFMDGLDSAKFTYFKVLVTSGFLELRKYSDRIIGLVEMMMQMDNKLPCFVGGPRIVEDLKERFVLGMTDREVDAHVDELIKESVNNWRTVRYDQYQFLTNGILA